MSKLGTKRLFGNENARHVPASVDDDWLEMQVAARVNGAAATAAAGQSPAAQPPPFPYPVVRKIDFTSASVGEIWVPASGYAVSFWDSTNITDVVNVRMARAQGDISGPAIPFRPGHALGLGDFTWIGLTWSLIAGASGTLLFLPREVILDENH